MKRLAFIAITSLAALGSVAADAAAVPDTVSFTGRVSDGSGPINGTVNLTFEIFDVPTGGSFIWDEAYTGVSASNGLVYVNLGSQQPFTAVEADGGDLYLQITVNGTVQTPRIPINSVPYATHAGTAATLGTLAPGDVSLSTHNHNAAYAALSHNHSSDYAALSHGHGSADIDAYQDLSDSGRFGADAATDVLLRSEGDTRYSLSAHTHSYAPLSHGHAATDITSGTLDNARFSAYSDLGAEGYLGGGQASDVLMWGDGDARYSLWSHTHAGSTGGAVKAGTYSSNVNLSVTQTDMATVSATFPAAGYATIISQSTLRGNEATNWMDCRLLEAATQIDDWYWESGDTDGWFDQHQSHATVRFISGAGARTYTLRCSVTGGTLNTATAFKAQVVVQYFPNTL